MVILDNILKRATVIKEHFDIVLKNNFPDYLIICPPLKTKQAIINKAKFRCFKPVNQIEDIVRATIVADTYEDILKIAEKVETLFDVMHIKDFFKTPAPTGFRDINIKIKFENFVVEILILLKDIYLLEISKTRKNYDKIKKLIERKDSEKFKTEILELKKANLDSFNDVIYNYNKTTKGNKLPLWDISQIHI